MRQRVSGIFLNCLMEIIDGLDESFFGSTIPIVAAAQVIFVSFRVDGTSPSQLRLFGRSYFDPDLSSNRLRHPALQSEHISQVAFIGLCPKVPVSGSFNQFRRDSHAIAGT